MQRPDVAIDLPQSETSDRRVVAVLRPLNDVRRHP
jgi:hypothetical protein